MSRFYLGGGVFDSTMKKDAVIFTLQTLWAEEDLGFNIEFDYKVNKKSIVFSFKRDFIYLITGGYFLADRDMMMLTGLPIEAFDSYKDPVVWPIIASGSNYYGDKHGFIALFKKLTKKYADVVLNRVIIEEADDVLVLKLIY